MNKNSKFSDNPYFAMDEVSPDRKVLERGEIAMRIYTEVSVSNPEGKPQIGMFSTSDIESFSVNGVPIELEKDEDGHSLLPEKYAVFIGVQALKESMMVCEMFQHMIGVALSELSLNKNQVENITRHLQTIASASESIQGVMEQAMRKGSQDFSEMYKEQLEELANAAPDQQ